MLDQNTFTETIRAVQDIIRTSAEPMTREEILSYFKDMDLNAQQEEMVLEFLSTPHDDPQPEENEPETKEAEYEETAEKEETKESSAKKESAKDSVTDNISRSIPRSSRLICIRSCWQGKRAWYTRSPMHGCATYWK